MNIKITSKELDATDAIKDYIEKKSEKLVKYFGDKKWTNTEIEK